MTIPAVPVVHDGKTWYGCCELCKQRIAADPARYTHSRDPVSGEVIDKATAALLSVGDRILYFKTPANRDRFAAAPSSSVPGGAGAGT